MRLFSISPRWLFFRKWRELFPIPEGGSSYARGIAVQLVPRAGAGCLCQVATSSNAGAGDSSAKSIAVTLAPQAGAGPLLLFVQKEAKHAGDGSPVPSQRGLTPLCIPAFRISRANDTTPV